MTYCVVVNKVMQTSLCPIAKLNCSFQHAKTNACCYSVAFINSEFTVNDLANLTGNLELSNREVTQIKTELLAKVKISLLK